MSDRCGAIYPDLEGKTVIVTGVPAELASPSSGISSDKNRKSPSSTSSVKKGANLQAGSRKTAKFISSIAISPI